MPIAFLLERAASVPTRDAIIWQDHSFTYGWLVERIDHWSKELDAQGIPPGSVVVLEGDYSPNSIAMLLALFARQCMVVPLTPGVGQQKQEYIGIAQGEFSVHIRADDSVRFDKLAHRASHTLYRDLVAAGHPGLVLFTSGSTGAGKAALHDVVCLLEKYRTRRHDLRTLAFLIYDHIGGVDTLLYSLSNTSCVVTVPDRSTDTVCAAIERFQVEVLPASPSFLNLLLLSQHYKDYDLSSLKYITYGSEVMPDMTLQKIHELFPGVKLLQKFGTTEVGTLRSQSRSSDSTWIRMGGDGYAVRVVDGVLQIKARSAITGYLNAPNPFTEDGWFITGDRVEVDGDYMRILGRDAEVINVGGEKVYPAEVENIIQEVDNVAEATVYGEAHLMMGHIVCARASMVDEEDEKAFTRRIKRYCKEHLEPFKVPVKVEVHQGKQHSERFKKMRRTP